MMNSLVATLKELIQRMLMSRGMVLCMTMRYLQRKRNICLPRYAGDYVRNSSLELVAAEIAGSRVPGNVAELGVYQGDFAKLINQLFPDRKLYLFDTFEGFHRSDATTDKTLAYSSGSQDFSGTSIDLILKKMPYRQQCVIKKGRFPESAAGVDDVFAFVSIDADLYAPIYEGLKFFYPRLAPGGYIFVHDYNNDEYKGAREAVLRFCGENNIPYVPMTDTCGTAVLSK
jgi:O-methyltransferase